METDRTHGPTGSLLSLPVGGMGVFDYGPFVEEVCDVQSPLEMPKLQCKCGWTQTSVRHFWVYVCLMDKITFYLQLSDTLMSCPCSVWFCDSCSMPFCCFSSLPFLLASGHNRKQTGVGGRRA